ncbi:MAG: DUF4133 domain-containing protein [Sediminibacterium sp.]|jgi:hypothetical protein|uniref:DUF4133 domain-containing protein n=1 Tax=Sediminibacterium sp. TaxID=1917865 RepID=UPI002ABB6EAF|nr:DUF4133 domain-containing protein [Sediminibacterium sp.]MDZ4070646.1 DUF4133 domain-containing protein [Sediminibacterium sp.]
MNSIYNINKGIGKPIVFRGLYGQYIYYLAIGMTVLLLLFVCLYLLGAPLTICTLLIIILGSILFTLVYTLNKRYGVHGWMKQRAARGIPQTIFCDQLFLSYEKSF